MEKTKSFLFKEFTELRKLEEEAHIFYSSELGKINNKKVLRIVKKISVDELKHMKIADELISIVNTLSKKKFSLPFVYDEAIKKISENMKRTRSPFSVMVKTSLESYPKTMLGILKYFSDKGKNTACFLINKPSEKITVLMEDFGQPLKKISFVSTLIVDKGGVIADPKNLTSLLINIQKKASKNQIIVLDSVSILYLYHPKEIVQRFIKSLVSLSQVKSFDLLIVELDSEVTNSNITDTFFDLVIKM